MEVAVEEYQILPQEDRWTARAQIKGGFSIHNLFKAIQTYAVALMLGIVAALIWANVAPENYTYWFGAYAAACHWNPCFAAALLPFILLFCSFLSWCALQDLRCITTKFMMTMTTTPITRITRHTRLCTRPTYWQMTTTTSVA